MIWYVITNDATDEVQNTLRCADGSPPPRVVPTGHTLHGPLTQADWDDFVVEREKIEPMRRNLTFAPRSRRFKNTWLDDDQLRAMGAAEDDITESRGRRGNT